MVCVCACVWMRVCGCMHAYVNTWLTLCVTQMYTALCIFVINYLQIMLGTGMTLTGVGKKMDWKLKMKRCSYSVGYKSVTFLCLLLVIWLPLPMVTVLYISLVSVLVLHIFLSKHVIHMQHTSLVLCRLLLCLACQNETYTLCIMLIFPQTFNNLCYYILGFF